MIINKEEVEKAAKEYIKDIHAMYHAVSYDCFSEGAKFVENKVQEYVVDIITENQGLKLYKDREAERFKELAVDFVEWYRESLRINEIKYPSIELEFNLEGKSPEELYEIFIKERNEKN